MIARRASALTLCIALASCGGGGRASSVVPTVAATTPTRSAQAVTFRVKIPANGTRVRALIRGKNGRFYTSPATLGVGVNYAVGSPVTFTAGQIATPDLTFDLSTCAANCVTNADGSHTYTIGAPIPPGTYTFEITTWDSAPVAGSFSGNILSQSLISQSIVAGSASTSLNLTLDAQPASVSLVPAPSQSHVAPNSVGGYELIGNAPTTFFLNAVDADGYIITGPGSPTIAPSDTTGSIGFTQSVSNPNIWTFQAFNANANSYQPCIGVSAQPAAGATTTAVQSTYCMTVAPELWLSVYGDGIWGYALTPKLVNTGSGNMLEYEPASVPTDYVSTNNAFNYSIAVDTQGNLWSGTYNGTTINEYSAPIGSTPPILSSTTITGLESVVGMSADATGLLWIADQGSNDSGAVYAYSGTTRKYVVSGAANATLANPTGVAVAPTSFGNALFAPLAGTIWVASPQGVDVLTVSNGTAVDTYPSVINTPTASVAVGPDGSVWTLDTSGNLIDYSVSINGSAPVATQVTSTSIGLYLGYGAAQQLAVSPQLLPGSEVWTAQGASGTESFYNPGDISSEQFINCPPSSTSECDEPEGLFIAP